LHRQAAEERVGIRLQGRRPLGRMLRILPTGFVRLDVGLGALLERHCSGGLKLGLELASLLHRYWVGPVQSHLATRCGALAGLCKCNRVDRAEAHFAEAPVVLETKDPGLCAVGADLEVEPAPVSQIATGLGA